MGVSGTAIGRRLFMSASAAGIVSAPAIVSAQGEWPNRQIRVVIPYPPGGPSDITTRLVVERACAMLGQSVLFDNRAGASGAIGAENVKNSPADGYTFLTTTTAMVCITQHLQPLPYDPAKDFVAVARTTTSWMGMGINPQVPANNLQEFIAYAKANPGKINFGSAGLATITQLYGEIFNIEAGVKMVHVPYKGSAPAMQDLLAGQVDMIFDNIPGAVAQMRSGKVRALGVTSLQRSPVAPEIPAMAEFLPGFDVNSWGGICGPAGLPPAMVEKLSALTKKALESEDLKAGYLGQGATPLWMSPADTAAYRAADEKRLAPIIKASGARVE
jgi:tripartite-type tricarboxylate transporter receptor subunit TctC